MKRLLFLLLSLVLVAVLVWKAGGWRILQVLHDSNPDWLALGIVTYFVSYIGRTLRFRCLLRQKRGGFGRLVQVVCWHNFCNLILPARTGELSFVYLVRQRKLDTAVSGLSALLVSRVFDLSAVLLFLSSALVVRQVNVFGLRPSILWPLVFVILATVAVILTRFSALLTWAVETSGPVLHFLHATHLSEKLREAASEFRRMESGALYRRGFAWTLFLWTFQFLTFYMLMLSFGVFFSFWEVVIGSAAAAMASFVPGPVGSFGPLEAGWALGFAFVGMSLSKGLATGFAMHVVVLGFSSMFASVALLFSIPQALAGKKAVSP